MFFYFLISPALSGPYGPGSPSVLLLCISGELCFCWFMPDLSHIPYFKFLRVRIWLAHLFVASHASGHRTICSWVILEWGVHRRGVRERAQQRLTVRGADSSHRQDSGLTWEETHPVQQPTRLFLKPPNSSPPWSHLAAYKEWLEINF